MASRRQRHCSPQPHWHIPLLDSRPSSMNQVSPPWGCNLHCSDPKRCRLFFQGSIGLGFIICFLLRNACQSHLPILLHIVLLIGNLSSLCILDSRPLPRYGLEYLLWFCELSLHSVFIRMEPFYKHFVAIICHKFHQHSFPLVVHFFICHEEKF